MSAPARVATRRRIMPWLLAGIVLVALGAHRHWWTFTCDDAYISFRYAERWAQLGVPTFDAAHQPPVEGYTNFLWVLLLAAGVVVGVAPATTANVLGFCAGAACLGVVVYGARRCGGLALRAALETASVDRAITAGTLALLLVTPAFVVWTSSGLETALASALTAGAFVALQAGRGRTAALLGAAAVLTRPDAVVPLTGVAAGWMLAAPRSGVRARAVVLGRNLGFFVAPIVAHLVWRYLTYEAWLPHTWEIKKHGVALAGEHGLAYLRVWARDVGVVWWAPALLAARRRHLVLIVPIVGTVGYVVRIGGDFMAYGRFLHGALLLGAMLLGWLLRDAAAAMGPRRAWWMPVFLAGLTAAGAAQARHLVRRDRAETWLDDRFETVTAMDRFARVRVAAGAWMRAHLPADTVVSVGAAGAMPYASGLSVIDTYGLVEPDISAFSPPRSGARARPGHQLTAPLDWVKARDPDLMCHLGHAGPSAPAAKIAQRRGRGPYRWACVPVGEIDLPLETPRRQDVGTYCCLRHQQHTVGPFGGAR